MQYNNSNLSLTRLDLLWLTWGALAAGVAACDVPAPADMPVAGAAGANVTVVDDGTEWLESKVLGNSVRVASGTSLHVAAGTSIVLRAGAGLFVEGNIAFEGRADAPVKVIGEPGNLGVVLLQTSSTGGALQHIQFDNVSLVVEERARTLRNLSFTNTREALVLYVGLGRMELREIDIEGAETGLKV